MKRDAAKRPKITIKDLEKEYHVKFPVPGNTNLTTYLKKQGFPSMAKFVDMLETDMRW